MKEAIEKKIRYGIYHYQNSGDPISWSEFAKEIFEIAGKRTKVTPISTEEYLKMNAGKLVAPRPKYSVLYTSKLEQVGIETFDWKSSLEKYLTNKETVLLPSFLLMRAFFYLLGFYYIC